MWFYLICWQINDGIEWLIEIKDMISAYYWTLVNKIYLTLVNISGLIVKYVKMQIILIFHLWYEAPVYNVIKTEVDIVIVIHQISI